MILAPFLLFLALLEKGKSALIVHLGVVQGTCNFEIVGSKFQDLGLTQIGKEELFAELLQFLRGGKTFLKGTASLDLHISLHREHPILMDILLGLCDEEECLPPQFRFLIFFLK